MNYSEPLLFLGELTKSHGKRQLFGTFCPLSRSLLQVHYILQEVVMGGMVLETNMTEIVAQVELQNRMEKSEVRLPTRTH